MLAPLLKLCLMQLRINYDIWHLGRYLLVVKVSTLNTGLILHLWMIGTFHVDLYYLYYVLYYLHATYQGLFAKKISLC